MERFFVVTGGPGSGKSTLIAALRERGLHTMPESGRAIIRQQVAEGGDALPWKNPPAFAEAMLAHDIASWRAAQALDGPVLFDRGIPDIAGYLAVTGMTVPPHIERATAQFRYNARVFIAPPWQAIFARDAERKQDFEEAQATHRAMIAVYSALGYALTPLPLTPVAERAQFVTSLIAKA